MSGPALDRNALHDALRALRAADDPGAPALGGAWRTVSDWIDARHRLPTRHHDDVRQRTLIKVLRGVDSMDADSPARASAWLRRVHHSALVEHHRRRDVVEQGLRTTASNETTHVLDRIAAPEAERTDTDADRLEAVLEAALERVEGWLEVNVSRPSKRAGDLRRAQIALLANVRGLSTEEIGAQLGVEGSKSAFYKWIERGREQVLLPALEDWEAQAGEDGEGAAIACGLRRVLEGSRRADAGRARPGRRRSVSRGAGQASQRGNDQE